MSNSCYAVISNFGAGAGQSINNNPLAYGLVSGLESGFHHTLGMNLMKPDSENVQRFFAQYCADPSNTSEWNKGGVCNIVYKDKRTHVVNTGGNCSNSVPPEVEMTYGQSLLRNTVTERYLKYMSNNCKIKEYPFDPTVANSYKLRKWVPQTNGCQDGNCGLGQGGGCVGIYDVDAKSIDSDPVMNELLKQPWVAIEVLINIYNTRMKEGTMKDIVGTKLYKYFQSDSFQDVLKVNGSK
jgi:hypothetical protein